MARNYTGWMGATHKLPVGKAFKSPKLIKGELELKEEDTRKLLELATDEVRRAPTRAAFSLMAARTRVHRIALKNLLEEKISQAKDDFHRTVLRGRLAMVQAELNGDQE